MDHHQKLTITLSTKTTGKFSAGMFFNKFVDTCDSKLCLFTNPKTPENDRIETPLRSKIVYVISISLPYLNKLNNIDTNNLINTTSSQVLSQQTHQQLHQPQPINSHPHPHQIIKNELFQNKKFDIPSISITQPTIATPSSSISTNNSNQAVIGSAVNVEITPTSNGNENEMSEKELKTLQAQLSAYRVDKDLLQREIEKLQEKSLSAELQYKQIISTCCKIDLDKVDDFVETILGEVDNDLEDEFSLGRIGEILGKLDKEASQL
ncbi:11798_t:CDS:2 [Entrophospora sp. SA101]|nr:11798_t:CDS:2 [Entrophospora sp. SA101]